MGILTTAPSIIIFFDQSVPQLPENALLRNLNTPTADPHPPMPQFPTGPAVKISVT